MAALRAKSERLTGYLEWLLDRLPPGTVEVITPREPARRGCQLSLRVRGEPRRCCGRLEAGGRGVRLPRARRDPRGAGAALQHLPRRLAVCARACGYGQQ